MTALITAEQFVDHFDERDIRDLLSDDGDPFAGDLATSDRLTHILESASGNLLAAASAGANYTEAELSGLEGNAQALMVEIVCTLAVVRLHRRRTNKLADETVKAWEEAAQGYLDMLRKGQRIFPVEAHQAAGLPTIGGPTAVDYNRMNLITTRTKNFYPSVASRLPLGRG